MSKSIRSIVSMLKSSPIFFSILLGALVYQILPDSKLAITVRIENDELDIYEQIALEAKNSTASGFEPSYEKCYFSEDEGDNAKAQNMSDYEIAMWLLKSYESLHFKSYWDVRQWTIGWGTKSRKGEVIDRYTADVRAAKEYARVYDNLTKRYPELTRWQRLILAVTDYNVGSFGNKLKAALKGGDSTAIAKVVKLYFHDANGKKLKGLVKRRNHEALLLTACEEEKQRIGKELKATVIKHIHKAKNR